jgi:hypothetical protein
MRIGIDDKDPRNPERDRPGDDRVFVVGLPSIGRRYHLYDQLDMGAEERFVSVGRRGRR